MFNRVQIWGLRWPGQDLKWLLTKPILYIFCSMLWVIVGLEDYLVCIKMVMFNGGVQVFLKDLLIQMLIHSSFDSTNVTRAFCRNATPDHHCSASVFHCLSYLPRLFSFIIPIPRTTLRIETTNFGFV